MDIVEGRQDEGVGEKVDKRTVDLPVRQQVHQVLLLLVGYSSTITGHRCGRQSSWRRAASFD